MFWRERERENKEHNGGVLCGQVRVLVVGDSGSSFLLPFLLLFVFGYAAKKIDFDRIDSG